MSKNIKVEILRKLWPEHCGKMIAPAWHESWQPYGQVYYGNAALERATRDAETYSKDSSKSMYRFKVISTEVRVLWLSEKVKNDDTN